MHLKNHGKLNALQEQFGLSYFAAKSKFDAILKVLEWADIVYNKYGYIELTPSYKELRKSHKA